jgi:AraC-like DNA-binding protein
MMGNFERHVRSASLSGYPALAASLGLNASALMRKAGLPRRCLDDPETPISLGAALQLMESSAQAAGIEDFGLRLASRRHLSSLGPVSLLLREEPTGLQALETLCRYLSLFNTSLLADLEEGDEVVIVRVELLVDQLTPTRQSIEFVVGAVCKILRDLMGARWRPSRTCFSHSPPRDRQTHREAFGAQLEFNSEFSGIVCTTEALRESLPRTDPAMARYARQFMEKLLVQSGPSSTETIRHLIATMLPGGRCTVEQIARQLGVNRRTVHRRLLTDGNTFSSVLRSVRRERAVRRLHGGDCSIIDLADQLGFSSASAFAHWFRGEFGMSVSSWRRQQ